MKGCQPLTDEQLEAISEHGFSETEYGVRGYAMFVLHLTTGVRISELLSVNLGDVVTENGQWVHYIPFRRRNVKGRVEGKRRLLRWEVRGVLGEWIEILNRWGGVLADCPLFADKSLKRLSRQRAYEIYRSAFRRADVTLAVPGTHTLRKTYADRIYKDLLRRLSEGESLDPLRGISQLLGHSNIASTESYLAFRYEQAERSLDAVTRSLNLKK